MKESFQSAWDVAHMWANQSQDYASCYRTSVHFNYNDFYSYNTVIGTIVTARNGERVYVLDEGHYSNTTSGHQSIMNQSIPAGEIEFHVDGGKAKSADYKKSEKNNRVYATGYIYGRKIIYALMFEAIKWLDKSRKARQMKQTYLRDARKAVNSLRRYIQLFGYDRTQWWYNGWDFHKVAKKSPIWNEFLDRNEMYAVANEFCCYDETSPYTIRLMKLGAVLVACGVLTKDAVSDEDWTYIREQYLSVYEEENAKAEIAAYDKWLKQKNAAIRRQCAREEAKRKAEEERWIAEQRAKDAGRIKHDDAEVNSWHNGNTRYNYLYFESMKYKYDLPYNAWLRIYNGHIETSKGICLSFEEGHRLWKVVRAFEAGHEFRHELVLDLNGSQWKFNEYKNHVLHAGCHLIPFFECQRIADQMGWEGCRTLVPMSHYNKAV